MKTCSPFLKLRWAWLSMHPFSISRKEVIRPLLWFNRSQKGIRAVTTLSDSSVTPTAFIDESFFVTAESSRERGMRFSRVITVDTAHLQQKKTKQNQRKAIIFKLSQIVFGNIYNKINCEYIMNVCPLSRFYCKVGSW